MAVRLIAPADRREALAAILRREAIPFSGFDTIEGAGPSSVPEAPGAVLILWSDSAPGELAQYVRSAGRVRAREPILLICPEVERRTVKAAIGAGAHGVLRERDADAALRGCLEAVRANQTCVPAQMRREVAPPALSAREKQVLGLVVLGYMNVQIAEQLFLAESTVKSHLSSAFAKLGVSSRNEAVSLIVDPEEGLGMGIIALGAEPMQTGTGTR